MHPAEGNQPTLVRFPGLPASAQYDYIELLANKNVLMPTARALSELRSLPLSFDGRRARVALAAPD